MRRSIVQSDAAQPTPGSVVLLPPVDAQHHAVVRDLSTHLVERNGARQPALVERLVADLHQRSGAHTIEPRHGGTRPLMADAPVRLVLAELLHVENGGATEGSTQRSDEAPTIAREPRCAGTASE